jgi:hypothetical protein
MFRTEEVEKRIKDFVQEVGTDFLVNDDLFKLAINDILSDLKLERTVLINATSMHIGKIFLAAQNLSVAEKHKAQNEAKDKLVNNAAFSGEGAVFVVTVFAAAFGWQKSAITQPQTTSSQSGHTLSAVPDKEETSEYKAQIHSAMALTGNTDAMDSKNIIDSKKAHTGSIVTVIIVTMTITVIAACIIIYGVNYTNSNYATNGNTTAARTITVDNSANLKVGDTVFFGTYSNEHLQWRVLAIENGRALLITKDCIATKQYNTDYLAVTWETSTLHSWLNNDFYNGFSAEEKQQISQIPNNDKDDTAYKTADGSNDSDNTEDNVFLLSVDEATEYFKSDADRKASYNGSAEWWWLRSSGHDSEDAAYINSGGGVNAYGYYVSGDNAYGGVRPALWLNL